MFKLLNPLPSLGNTEKLISQKFGENSDLYSPMKGHEGLDFACPVGTPVYSMGIAPGHVVDSKGFGNKEREKFYGEYVLVEYPGTKEFPQGYLIMYAHLKMVACRKGNLVGVGQYIGTSGNTGRSTGPHLHIHFQPKPVDSKNGYGGCINMESFIDYSGKFTKDLEKYEPVSYVGRKYGADESSGVFEKPREMFPDKIVEAHDVFGDHKKLIVTATDGLNLRNAPDGGVIETLNYEEIVTLLDHELIKEEKNLFAKVGSRGGAFGYSAVKWLEPFDDESSFKKFTEKDLTVFKATKALKVKEEDSTPIALAKTIASGTGKSALRGGFWLTIFLSTLSWFGNNHPILQPIIEAVKEALK